MPTRHPMHTGYTQTRLGDLKGWLFHPLRPGESLTGLEVSLSIQMDKLVQEIYSPPLIVDTGIWRVPLTLIQSAFGDDYVKAFAGEFPPAAALNRKTDGGSGGNIDYIAWKQIKYDLLAEIARTFFSRNDLGAQNVEPDQDHVFCGLEFLPAAAGEHQTPVLTSAGSSVGTTTILDLLESLKQDRLEEATYLEALNRFGISGREARHIPEVVMWERRMLTPRQDLLVTGSGGDGTGAPANPPRVQIGNEATAKLAYVAGSVPAASLGLGISERRDKHFYSADPSILVGASLVRWATFRAGAWGHTDVADPRQETHMALMLRADDWCPPGTGFNDAVRYMETDTDGTYSPNNIAMSFDPMMYLWYGESYYSLGQATGNQGGRPNDEQVYNAVGQPLATQGSLGTSWNVIQKGFARLDIRTDLGEE